MGTRQRPGENERSDRGLRILARMISRAYRDQQDAGDDRPPQDVQIDVAGDDDIGISGD